MKGYRRADGSVGIRNHVLVIPSVFCANSVCKRIAENVEGAVSVEHQHGCGQIGIDKEQTKQTFVNFSLNPNVFAVIVVGLGCEGVASKGVAESIRKHTSKPVHEFSIQGVGGTPASIEKGIKI